MEWSEPSEFWTTHVHHGYRRCQLVNARNRTPDGDTYGHLLDLFPPVFESWMSHIDPGGFIVPHRDSGPYRERWQYPLQPAGVMITDRVFEAEADVPFRVKQWEPHSVWNLTDRPRIHMIVDLDGPYVAPTAKFELFPVPDEYRHLTEL